MTFCMLPHFLVKSLPIAQAPFLDARDPRITTGVTAVRSTIVSCAPKRTTPSAA